MQSDPVVTERRMLAPDFAANFFQILLKSLATSFVVLFEHKNNGENSDRDSAITDDNLDHSS